MKILMLTPYLPYPPASGGQIRTLNLLKYLSKHHEITLISLYKNTEEKKYLPYLKPFCSSVYLCKRPEKPWQLKNIFSSVFSNKPFLIVRNYSSEAKDLLFELINKNHYDVIHAETFYIMPHIPQTSIPIFLVEQTIEYQVYQHFVNSLPFFLKPIFRLDIVKLKYWEQYYWKKAFLVGTVSESDKKIVHRLDPTIHPVIVPNGAGDEMLAKALTPKDISKPVVLFQGNFFWLQNTEAAKYLIHSIYPLLRKKIPLIRLIIAGQNAQKTIHGPLQQGVEVVDIEASNVELVKKLYHEATLFIAPISGPGGTRLKILAAMAAGLPVISSRTGVQGLNVKDKEHVLIAKTPTEYVDKACYILSHKARYETIRKNAYYLVKEKYNWHTIGQKLEIIYGNIKKT